MPQNPFDAGMEEGWGDELEPAPDPFGGLEFFHLEPGESTRLVVLCHRPLPYIAHYHSGIREYVRCELPGQCPKPYIGRRCSWSKMSDPRLHLVSLVLVGERQWVFECTKTVRDRIRPLAEQAGGLFGLSLHLVRPPGGNNPSIFVQPGEPVAPDLLPAPADWRGFMRDFWQRQDLRLAKRGDRGDTPHKPPPSGGPGGPAGPGPQQAPPRSGSVPPRGRGPAPGGRAEPPPEVRARWDAQDRRYQEGALSLFERLGGDAEGEPETEAESAPAEGEDT